MFYVYILKNTKTSQHYTGFTNDLRKRVEQHNLGKNLSTKHGKWEIIYYEACLNIKDALRRERFLKSTLGRRMLKLRLKEYFNEE